MEKRIGTILILINSTEFVSQLNAIISDYSYLIIGRQGIPLRDKNQSIISLVTEGSTDEISAITGKIGRLKHIRVKSVLMPVNS